MARGEGGHAPPAPGEAAPDPPDDGSGSEGDEEGEEGEPARLSEEQQAAARADPATATVVLAAAGTGKTSCLVARTRFLLSCGADSVLVLTFSRRAQQEFAARLRAGRRRGGEGVEVRTFHSQAYALLREHYAEAGWTRPPSVLAEDARAEALLMDCWL